MDLLQLLNKPLLLVPNHQHLVNPQLHWEPAQKPVNLVPLLSALKLNLQAQTRLQLVIKPKQLLKILSSSVLAQSPTELEQERLVQELNP